MSLRHAVSLLTVLLLMGGCGDDGSAPAATTTSSTTTPSSTTTVSSTTTADATTTTSTTTDDSLVVQVFFLDQDAFNIGRLPYVRPVERTVAADAPEAAALDALFAGPTSEEATGGLRFVASEATGVAELTIVGRTALVHLAGGCSSGGSTFTVANEIVPTLLQFTSIDAVKIFDPEGRTGSPDEPGDSIPECLEP